MRKLAVAGGLCIAIPVASFATETNASNPFIESAHIPQAACQVEVVQHLGSLLSSAIELDIANAIGADESTHTENNMRVEADQIDDYPTIGSYFAERVYDQEIIRSPETSLTFQFSTDTYPFKFHAENFDLIVQEVLQSDYIDDPLRTETYACFWDELYNRQSLQNELFEVAVLDPKNCLSRDRILPRLTNLCTANGRHVDRNSAIIISPGYKTASKAMLHEFWHWLQQALGAKPEGYKADKKREYSAAAFAEKGLEIMEQSDQWIFTNTDNCINNIALSDINPYNYPCFGAYSLAG